MTCLDERDEWQMEKLSLRKQSKLKCQVQNIGAFVFKLNYMRAEDDANLKLYAIWQTEFLFK